MPRNGRGGARTGRPGVSYPNRSDLHTPLPAQAPAGQEYGARLAQLQAQQAVPIAPAPPGGTAAPGGGGAPPAAGAPPPGPAPGEVMPLGAPSQRPDEPVTHGLPTGPGAGPEALGAQGANLGQLFQSLADQSGNDTFAALAQRAKAMGQ